MADKNEVVLEGHIKGKVFNFWGQEGKTSVLKINLEVNSEYVGSDGKLKHKNCTVPVTLFGPLADKYKPGGAGGELSDPMRIAVTGYITNNSYTSKKTNEKVFETVVIARTAEVIQPAEPWSGGPPEWNNEPLPF